MVMTCMISSCIVIRRHFRSIQQRLAQCIDYPARRFATHTVAACVALSSQLLLQQRRFLLGSLGGIRHGRVDQRSDRIGQIGRLDTKCLSEVVDLRLYV